MVSALLKNRGQFSTNIEIDRLTSRNKDVSRNVMINTELAQVKKYSMCHGVFDFKSERPTIAQVAKRNNVSTGFGVYVVYGCSGTDRKIIYIGKSGAICQSGRMKEQGIRALLSRFSVALAYRY